MIIRGSVVSLSFIFSHPPEDKKIKIKIRYARILNSDRQS